MPSIGAPPPLAKRVSDWTYRLDPSFFHLRDIRLQFSEGDRARLTFTRLKRESSVPVGLDGLFRFARLDPAEPTLAARGNWLSSHEFLVELTEADGVNHFRLRLAFDAHRLLLRMGDLTSGFPAQEIVGNALERP